MDDPISLVVVFALGGVIYAVVRVVRRIGPARFLEALGALVMAICGAFAGLFKSEPRPSASGGEGRPDGGDDHWTKAQDRVGAVSLPEQHVQDPDPEISSLAQMYLDDD